MATKAERAATLFAANPSMGIPQLTELFVKELGMTPLGARTYAYNVRKAAGAPPTPKKEKVARAVSTKVSAPRESIRVPSAPAHVRIADLDEAAAAEFVVPAGRLCTSMFTKSGLAKSIAVMTKEGATDFSEPVFFNGMWRCHYFG